MYKLHHIVHYGDVYIGNSRSGQKGIYLSLKSGQGTGTAFSEKLSTTSTYIPQWIFMPSDVIRKSLFLEFRV